MADRTVIVGDETLPIPRMNGFKVLRAGDAFARLSEKYPEVMREAAQFSREYQSENSVRVTPDMAKAPRFRSWELSPEDFGEKGYIELPQAPTQEELIAAMFPKVFTVAKTEVAEMIALVLTPNAKLEEADEAGDVDQFIASEAKRLLHRAYADQYPDIVLAVADVLRENFAGKGAVLGKLLAAWSLIRGNAPTSQTTPNPSLSIDSPSPTDGPEPKSSTAEVGVS